MKPRASTTGALVLCVALVACGSGPERDPLSFSTDAYAQACQEMRANGKPTPEHIQYLRYTPASAAQEGVFMVAVFNPLASAQLRCGSVVMSDDGQPEMTEVPDMATLKAELDNTFQVMVVGYTTLTAAGSPLEATVFLRNQRGDETRYPAEVTGAFTPTDAACTLDGCGHVHNSFVGVRANPIDSALFTGSGGVLRLRWRDQPQEFDFTVPAQ